MFTKFTFLASALLAGCFLDGSEAHSYLVTPPSRIDPRKVQLWEGYTFDWAGTLGCPPMGVNKPTGAVTSYKAGETIDVSYWRNNHIGGFIRWALIPKGMEESGANFDKNVFAYTCRESGAKCVGGDNTWWSYDKDYIDYSVPCGDKITLPDWYPAGDYVLQWTWFASGNHGGAIEKMEPTYRSCADLKLTAGTGTRPACPTFTGGDRMTKLENKTPDQCFYMYEPKIPTKEFVGNANGDLRQYYHYGKPSAWVECMEKNPPTPAVTPPPSTAAPTPPVTTKPKITGLACNYEGNYYRICRLSNAWSFENGEVCVGITRCISQEKPYGVVSL